MADNVTVANSPLTDYPVSTDEVVGPPIRHVQRVKLAYSADGDETHIGADVNGLDVDVTRSALPTGAAQEHATAASPHAARLSDGAAFYDAVKTGQLPAALGTNGGLKIEGVASGTPVPVSATSLPLPTGAATEATLASRLVGNLSGPATWQAVPTVAADLIVGTCTVIGIHFVNTTAAQLSVTVKDRAGTPLTVLDFDIPARSVLDLTWKGTQFTSGINWVASGAGVRGAVVAYQ